MSEAPQHPVPSGLPEWLTPVVEGARTITVHDLTRYQVPPTEEPRRSAVLMLFADTDGDGDGEILLTERSHTMRSHPGQVSFPGGTLDPGESAVQGALREAQEEIGLNPEDVVILGTLPELWLPPSNFAVTPVLGYWAHKGEVYPASPDEVHAIHTEEISDLLDPANRVVVRHPSGWLGPGFLIGEQRDVILWGFTAGVVARFFEHIGWESDWDRSNVRDLPEYMFAAEGPAQEYPQNTDLESTL